MTLAPLLFATTLMMAPGAAPDEQTRPIPPPPSTAPHTLSVGGSIVAGSNGATGSFAYWFGDHVGVQMSVGYFVLPNYYSTGSNGSTFQAAPSMMVLLTKPNQTRDVNFRPYVGGGINYVSSSSAVVNTRSTAVSTSGTGGQVFGGVEMSFKDTPQFGVTMEAAYFHLPSGFVGTGYIGGMNYLLGFHFYLK
jgi:outer membrane protein W